MYQLIFPKSNDVYYGMVDVTEPRDYDKLDTLNRVFVNGQPLNPSPLAKHWNGETFSWGYQGNGPKCLAHSILYCEFGVTVADAAFKAFEQLVVSNWPMKFGSNVGKVQWTYTSAELHAWARRWQGAVDSPSDIFAQKGQ
jgi:hypothetical protein